MPALDILRREVRAVHAGFVAAEIGDAPQVCEESFAMGEEFLTDQADLGQLEFDAILRKVDAKDASYKN